MMAAALGLFVQSTLATTCSYLLNLPSGYSLIANHCDHTGGNTLNNVFPSVPECSAIFKFNKQTQSFDPPAVFSGGTWTPNLVLDPGEGAAFLNPSAGVTVTVSGTAHTPVLPLILAPGVFCLISRQEPLSGPVASITGQPAEGGDAMFRFESGNYVPYMYDEFGSGWSSSDPVNGPTINVGEAVFYIRGGGSLQAPAPCIPATFCSQPSSLVVTDCCDSSSQCATFTATAVGSVTYQWYADGVAIPNAVFATYMHCPVTAADNGKQFTVKIMNGCGSGVTSQAATLTVVPDTIAPVLAGCANLTVVAEPGQGGATVSFPPITATDNCDPTVSVSCDLNPGFFSVGTTVVTCDAIDDCGNRGLCSFSVTVTETVTLSKCSFTQGFFGNPKGKFNGVPSLTLVSGLLAQGPLIVGKVGSRSLAIQPGDALLLQQRLPSGGPPATLPNNGDQTLLTAILPLGSKGKFDNVLLGQTITLSLNVRLSPALLNIGIPPSFCTQGVLPGPDGLKGTADDVPISGDILMFTIPNSVRAALADPTLGINLSTVQGLLELANRALAGLPTGGASLPDINHAVDAINRGFDDCRLLVDCATGTIIPDSVNDAFSSRPPLGSSVGGRPQGLEIAAAGDGGMTNARARVSNLGAGKEAGEPNHGGNGGGRSVWWRWLAPGSGTVRLETGGSSFDTLLGVYTGSSLAELVLIAGNDDDDAGVMAGVTFQAVAGTEYQIAVDGFDQERGTVVLSLIVEQPRLCLPVVRNGNEVQLCVDGLAGRLYTVEASSNLNDWTPVSSQRNSGGVLTFIDPGSADGGQRFYRVILEF